MTVLTTGKQNNDQCSSVWRKAYIYQFRLQYLPKLRLPSVTTLHPMQQEKDGDLVARCGGEEFRVHRSYKSTGRLINSTPCKRKCTAPRTAHDFSLLMATFHGGCKPAAHYKWTQHRVIKPFFVFLFRTWQYGVCVNLSVSVRQKTQSPMLVLIVLVQLIR